MMFDVEAIVKLHRDMTRCWHSDPNAGDFGDDLRLVWQQHRYNFELWHEEDKARCPNASYEEIAKVKQAIDRLNQSRNDYIEKLDDWLTEELLRNGVTPSTDARLNTETPGSAIDRMSILALRIYHYYEQVHRSDAGNTHKETAEARLRICELQLRDLAKSLTELLADICDGTYRHRTYRQMKMYNDPSFNPYLYIKRK